MKIRQLSWLKIKELIGLKPLSGFSPSKKFSEMKAVVRSILLSLILCDVIIAQNLIPNPSFELTNGPCQTALGCPFLRGGIGDNYHPTSRWVLNWYNILDYNYYGISYNFFISNILKNGKLYPTNQFLPYFILYSSMFPTYQIIPQPRTGDTYLMMISNVVYRYPGYFCFPTTNRETPYTIVGVNLKDTVKNGEYCGFFYVRSDHRNPFRYKNFGIFLKEDSLFQPLGPNVSYTNADLPNLGHIITINDSASLNQSYEWKKVSFKTTINSGEYTMLYLGWFSHPLDNVFSHIVDSTSYLAHSKCNTANYELVPYGYSALLYIDDVHFFRCSDTVFSVHLPADTVLCDGDSLVLTPTVIDSLYALENETRSYLWSTGDTTPTITVTQPGSYWVRVTIDGEFTAWSDTIHVGFISDFVTTALPHPDTICEGLSAQLAVQVPAGMPGITTVWSTGDTAFAITVREPGTYTAYTYNECFAHTDTFTLYTRFCWDKEQAFTTLYIPNAFTPNGDGRNDCFEVVGEHLGSYQIQVFSRWGELVYQSDDIGQCWDGTHRGRPVPDGVYLYVIRHTDRHGNPMPVRRGEIRLYR